MSTSTFIVSYENGQIETTSELEANGFKEWLKANNMEFTVTTEIVDSPRMEKASDLITRRNTQIEARDTLNRQIKIRETELLEMDQQLSKEYDEIETALNGLAPGKHVAEEMRLSAALEDVTECMEKIREALTRS